MPPSTRRGFLAACAVAGTSPVTLGTTTSAEEALPMETIRFCLNTSTIRGQQLSLEQIVDLAAAAGYQCIEPWIREIEAYRDAGKSLPDLRKRIADHGLTVASSIGFAHWLVDDDQERRRGLEQLKRDMELIRSLGGRLIAAPPVGMQQADAPRVDLRIAAERYCAALEVGREMDVIPQLEVWGFSRNLSRLSETAFVAVESNHPDACILPDVYHLYKGGSGFQGLGMLSGNVIHCFHVNDYPADPPRTEINDSKRVYPGDGIAPWKEIVGALNQIGFSGVVSLELFNEALWKQDPALVLKTGLEKMKALFAPK